MTEPCRNCPALISPVGQTGLWEDKNGITQCLKAPLGADRSQRVMHQPMADASELPSEAREHFPGCHPEDARSDDEADTATAGQPVQACWHCGTPTPRGCECPDCQDGDDYVPTTAIYHCPVCRRWWAWMIPRITTITFGADPEEPREG